MLLAIFMLIYVGLIGGGVFTAGIVLSMMSLVVAGIVLLVLSILGMIVYCLFCRPPTVHTHNPLPAASYSTNNMNTMKRNKSDTDLELINRQTAAAADYEGNLV